MLAKKRREMMREIKFRAWHDNETWPVRDLNWDAGGIASAYLGLHTAQEGDFILMQFTGLKDKNGVEIYEGDIVRNIEILNGNFVNKITDTYIVIFQGCSFQYKPNKNVNVVYTINPIGCDVEVIGNIYEHPHLLERY